MKKEMTTDECLEIFKKYDMELYNYYHNNMWYFGWEARRYAEYLKRNNEGDANFLYAVKRLREWNYRVDILCTNFARVYYKDGSDDFTGLEPCDSTAHGDVMIEGKCQNIDEWLERGL